MVPPNVMATNLMPPGMMPQHGMMYSVAPPTGPFSTVRDVRPPPLPAEQFTDLENMRVPELQQILQRYNVPFNDVLEKKDLVIRVREVLAAKEKETKDREEAEKKIREEKERKEREEKERVLREMEEIKRSTMVDAPSISTGASTTSPNSSQRQSKVEDSDDDPDKNVCVICLDTQIGTVFLECGHMACCVGCSTKVVNCPICRRPIARVINVFQVGK
jgi:hypothetical protein